ncbi:MAG: hypothetical protein ACLFPL_02100, partial [Candidatus Nanoarchaeia archaeon]
MINRYMLLLLTLIIIISSAYATDVYSRINFDYQYGSNPDDLEVKMFKCEDSSCEEGKVNTIPTQIYTSDSKSACFKNLNKNQMDNCMNNYAISGDKAPSSGMVVKLSNAQSGPQQYYLVTVSAKDDTYATKHIRIQFNTNFNDYDYITNDFDFTLNKVFQPKANIQSFFVDNLENPKLPIQVNVEAGMSSTVCSGFNYATDYFKPQFSSGYSDYSAKTDIILEIIDKETGSIIDQSSKVVDIEASTCTGFHQFEWTPPSQYEDKEIEFKVRTNIIDDQAFQPREDRDSKVVTIYPEDLTNACYVNGNNLVVANTDTRFPQVGEFEITQGENAYLSFEAEAFQSQDKDGDDLQYIDYRVQIDVEGTQIIDEVVSSNSGIYEKNIKQELSQFSEGEYEVRAKLTPVGSEKCSQSEDSTLTTLIDIIEEPEPPQEPDNNPTLNTPDELNGGENNQVQGTISANDQEDGDLTDDISCSTSSSRISVDDSNGQ